MKIVNAQTEVYAILGDPISHSLSPVIMNRSFNQLQMDKVFLGFRCEKENFENVFEALKKLDLKGYVFTMPLKELVANHIDELTEEAALSGAVNCVIHSNGRFIGYNTDSIGFWNAVKAKKEEDEEINNLFVLGMGGFAKAVVTQAALQGVKQITVTNHFEEVEILKSFTLFLERLYDKVPDLQVKLVPWNSEMWEGKLSNSDVIVNATPNGMNNEGDLHLQFPYGKVKSDCIFFDAIYTPVKTKFLSKAEKQGHRIIDGLDLLANQGVCAFEIWTKQKVNPNVMKEHALEFLENQ